RMLRRASRARYRRPVVPALGTGIRLVPGHRGGEPREEVARAASRGSQGLGEGVARDDPVGGRERQERGAERGSEGGGGGRAVEWLEDEPELVGLGGARAEEHGGIAPCAQFDPQAVGGHLDRLGILLPEVA